MSYSETITREDLANILNEVLPAPQPCVVGVSFDTNITSKTTGVKTASFTITVPTGYSLVQNCRPVGLYVSGDPRVSVTDRGVVYLNGNTISFNYYLYNPSGVTATLALVGSILFYRN